MNTFKYALILGTAASIVACGGGSSKSKNKNHQTERADAAGSIELVTPAAGNAMIEDFPLAEYVTLDGEMPFSNITSIDINWPEFHIQQSGIELGFVDGESDELFYHSLSEVSSGVVNASDFDKQASNTWIVSGDNTLALVNDAGTINYELDAGSEFTEVTVSDDAPQTIWTFDIANNAIYVFDQATETYQWLSIEGNMNITGISANEDNFLVLADDAQGTVVSHYSIDGIELEYNSSWYIEGFEQEPVFNDISLMPDGRVAVSTTDTQNNLFLLLDAAALTGAGPIEDSAELELVNTIELPEEIQQPSGLWSMADNSWIIVTDQAEVAELDENFNLISIQDLSFDSLTTNQGSTEAVVGGDGEFWALTEKGLVGHFVKGADGFSLNTEYNIDITDEDGESYEYSGLAYNDVDDQFYLIPNSVDEHVDDEIFVLDSSFKLISRTAIFSQEETEGSTNEYDAQGLLYENGELLVLSEQFTKVLRVSLSGEILDVFELDRDDVFDPSELAMRDDQLYIIGDHENGDPVPPVAIFSIESEEDED